MNVITEIIVRLQNKDENSNPQKKKQQLRKQKKQQEIAPAEARAKSNFGPFVAHMTVEECKELRVGSDVDVWYVCV